MITAAYLFYSWVHDAYKCESLAFLLGLVIFLFADWYLRF